MKLIKIRDFIIIDVYYVSEEKPLANSSRTLCLRRLEIESCGDCVFSKVQVCWKFDYYIDTINNYVR